VVPVIETELELRMKQPLVTVEGLTERETAPVKPPEGVMVILPEVEAPEATVAAGALTARLKEGVVVVPPGMVRVMEPLEASKMVSPE
jgi:hypothetical protein